MSIITALKTEIQRAAGVVGAGFSNKRIAELEDYSNDYNFDTAPLINWVPINTVRQSIGASRQMIYNGETIIQFLTIADTDDRLEEVKDVLIDSMFALNESFYIDLFKDPNRVFNNPSWEINTTVIRKLTANYLVGAESRLTFTTACNRI